MKCNSDKLLRLVLVLGLISLEAARPQAIDIDGFEERDYDKGCSFLNCERGEVCVDRRFSCKKPPCPRMLFCARTKKDFAKGPATCDFVRCTRGHVCVVKVRRCHWDEKCAQQIARCVSEKDHQGDPASCAGFDCPAGDHCILKETDCPNPPCKLSSNCERSADVQAWHAKCRSLNCPSEYECFLRKTEENCSSVPCDYIPDCTATIEDELRSEYCEGWICPRYQTCVAKVVGSCEGNNCDIMRSCQRILIQDESTFDLRSGIAEETFLHQHSGRMETTYTTSEEFQDWLESVKATLGPDTYKRWLDYIRHSANSEWIPIPRSILSVGPQLNVGGNVTDAESVKESLSETKEIQNSDIAPSIIAISHFETQTENNNGNANHSECQCANSKFDYNKFGDESESNGTSDESLDKLNVSELLGMIDEIITILNSSSVDDAIEKIITQGASLSLNIPPSESQDEITHPEFSLSIPTREHKYSELPGRTDLNYSTSESNRLPAKTPEEFTDRRPTSLPNKLEGEEDKRNILSFFESMKDIMNKSCSPSNVSDCVVQQFYETNENNTERNKAVEIELLHEQTKKLPEDEKEENETISDTNSSAPSQASFANQEQIPRTAQPIYKDEQLRFRAALYPLPSYGARYTGNSSYGDYEFFNSPHEKIDTSNANLTT